MSNEIEFREWPKTTRFFREIVVSEKIDGTNAAIIVTDDGQVGAQSRSRIIVPGDDNFGFARWVHANAAVLADLCGPGYHFGEWWGNGVQRKYNQTTKRFSFFNTAVWGNRPDFPLTLDGVIVDVVPVLYQGVMDTAAIQQCLLRLQTEGSVAAPGFMNPEGVCIYHTTSRVVQKVTLDKEDRGKWEVIA